MTEERNEKITDELIAIIEEIDLFNKIKCSSPDEVCERQVFVVTIAYVKEGVVGVSGTCIPHIGNLAAAVTTSEGGFSVGQKKG